MTLSVYLKTKISLRPKLLQKTTALKDRWDVLFFNDLYNYESYFVEPQGDLSNASSYKQNCDFR